VNRWANGTGTGDTRQSRRARLRCGVRITHRPQQERDPPRRASPDAASVHGGRRRPRRTRRGPGGPHGVRAACRVGRGELGRAAATPADLSGNGGSLGALPEQFPFTPPVADQSTPADTARSTADEETTQPQGTSSTETGDTQVRDTDAQDAETPSTEASGTGSQENAPAPTPGLLPSIPGSPVGRRRTRSCRASTRAARCRASTPAACS